MNCQFQQSQDDKQWNWGMSKSVDDDLDNLHNKSLTDATTSESYKDDSSDDDNQSATIAAEDLGACSQISLPNTGLDSTEDHRSMASSPDPESSTSDDQMDSSRAVSPLSIDILPTLGSFHSLDIGESEAQWKVHVNSLISDATGARAMYTHQLFARLFLVSV